MRAKSVFKWEKFWGPGSFILSLLLFGFILRVRIPYSFSQFFYTYSTVSFLIVLLLFSLAYRLPERYRQPVCLGLAMLLFSLSLSYKWTSGYSDNKVIAGFLPYKDGAGYYQGASLLLNGLPLENTLQAGWRPLFPGFLASMLSLLGGNLQIALAVLVLLAALGAWLASRRVFASFGAFPAALFMTLLYFYIQPMLGLTMTELLGFSMGCFAFAILWMAALNPRWTDYVIGLGMLVLAMSVRAGTFLMLPLLAIWAGRIFRGTGRFSWRALGISLLLIFLFYWIANTLFARWVGVPEGRVFGNFAYSLYGQVQGGTGWHRAIDELGTRDPAIIYRAAFQFFVQHPLSLFIGTAKAYRDFFLPGDRSMFAFNVYGNWAWINYVIWAGAVFLLIRGLVQLVRNRSSNLSLLLLAGFLGILFSIPFLPPIDGGSRFYASTAPFFFILPVIGISKFEQASKAEEHTPAFASDRLVLCIGSLALLLLTVVLPPLILRGNSVASLSAPECAAGEAAFVIHPYPGSHVDLVTEDHPCGLAPEICLGDFDQHAVERTVDDFYQTLYALARENNANVRVVPAVNLLDARLRYFVIPREIVPAGWPEGLVAGCALENETKNQTIYQVKSISPIRE